MTKKLWWWLPALVLAIAGSAARADVAVGDRITAENIDKVKELISPGLEWCIRHGWPITVGETKHVDWLKAYKEATEKYSSQVKLSADGLSVQNFVAGQPFPNLDPKDPQIAMKIMWNYEYGQLTDDLDIRNFDADTGAITDHGPMTIERHFLLDHFRRLFWNGRLYVDPKPEKPNPNGYRRQEGLYPILEPFDLKGVGALSNRYIDSGRQDDSWLYLPSLRRVRRLSTAQRSDALFGQDTDVDSYCGYAGHIAWMTWRYLGERDLLGAFHSRHFPAKWDDKVDWAFDDTWEKRRVYVVEGISKLSAVRLRQADDLHRQGVVADPVLRHLRPLRRAVEDLGQQLGLPPKAFETPDAIEYPDEMAFSSAIVMVDMQLEHATKASLPSLRFPGRAGLVLQPGRAIGHRRRVVHGRRAGGGGALRAGGTAGQIEQGTLSCRAVCDWTQLGVATRPISTSKPAVLRIAAEHRGSHALGEPAHQREAQARALAAPRELALAAVERLEDLAEVRAPDARVRGRAPRGRCRSLVARSAQQRSSGRAASRAYFTALSTRLKSTCRSASRSKRTGGSAGRDLDAQLEPRPSTCGRRSVGHLGTTGASGPTRERHVDACPSPAARTRGRC